MKLCLHWPADSTGRRKLKYNELTQTQKEQVRTCSKSQVAVIARLVRKGLDGQDSLYEVPLYVARYANCFRGNSEANIHAEEFLIADEGFLQAIQHIQPPLPNGMGGGAKLLLYMTYQPCHHSGGRVPNDPLAKGVYTSDAMGAGGAGPQHATTCSERLREWFLNVLRPRGIELSLI